MKKLITLLLTLTMVFGSTTPVYASTKSGTPPVVKEFAPINNAVNVPIDQTLNLVYNKNIFKGKNFTAITLTDSNGFEINYKIKITDKTLSVKSVSNLEANMAYKLTIPASALKDQKGTFTKKAVIVYYQTGTTTAANSTTDPTSGLEKLGIKEIAKKAASVVFFESLYSDHKAFATGSGFIINGKLITNYHVIDGASYATITTDAGKKYEVTGIYAYDKEKDLAILEVDSKDIASLTLGDSDKITIGEAVIAIGSPAGLQNTVSQGIISSIRKDGYDTIQISVPIYSGSSGGALFNEYGNVIGITSSGYDTTGDLNFAIPINLIKPMLNSSNTVSLKSLIKPTGKLSFKNSQYEGDILDGQPNGIGVITFPDGASYTGSWKNGDYDGQGTYKWANGATYTGNHVKGRFEGQGTLTSTDGRIYVGAFKEDKFNGKGTLTYKDGRKYVGEFKNDMFDGQGTYTFASGSVYVGGFKEGDINGAGTLTLYNGDKYVGEFVAGKYEGQGTMTYADGEKYVGSFKNDVYEGQGTLISANGSKYVGAFKNGYANGQGTFTSSSGKVETGNWVNGKLVP